MQQTAVAFFEGLDAIVWGPPMLVLLGGTGLYLTVRLRGLQLRMLGHSLWLAFVQRKEPDAEGDISHFQALMTALSATVGTGNIVGVATAIQVGGPGAIFWMWVTGVFGMATKYAEALLAVRYRVTDDRGNMSGGPMYYLRRGLRNESAGRFLGGAFALFAAVAAFGTGNAVQSNSVADALEASLSIPPAVSGLVLTGLIAAVALGGIQSIGRAASVVVPTMIVLYIVAILVVLAVHASAIPQAFALIFEGAFGGTAAAGGFAGATVAQAIRFGVARGVFSNESGLGSSAIAAAAAMTREPVRQALVSMTQTFIDTIVVCTATGLVIVVTGAWASGLDGAAMTEAAFELGLPGRWGGLVVSVALSLFAFSTILGWGYYGEKSAQYLFGERVVIPYRWVFVAFVFPSAIIDLHLVWAVADVFNALMALPNLVGILALSGVIAAETRNFLERNA